jgi:hypothetical protein
MGSQAQLGNQEMVGSAHPTLSRSQVELGNAMVLPSSCLAMAAPVGRDSTPAALMVGSAHPTFPSGTGFQPVLLGAQAAPYIFLKFSALKTRGFLFFNRKSKTDNRKL